VAIPLTRRAAGSFALGILCSACLRFGYGPEQRNQAGRSGTSGSGEIDAGVPRAPNDGGGAPLPTTDAGSGDAAAFDGGMDAATASVPDAGIISELPPIPIDAGPEDVPADAGMTMPLIDAGVVQLDAATPPTDAGLVIVDAGMDTGVTSACLAGRELGGFCWFLGAVDQSCETVCAAHGGFVPSLAYVGSRAQGGARSRCDAVLTLLTAEGTTQAGYREDGRGVGCHIFEGNRWWLTSPSFSATAYHWKAQQACSCVDQ
jgi:hypothetical protein